MHIEEQRWWSNHLNRDMALKIYGHWGKPFIVFPCSRGRYFDYEGMGMIEAIAGFINGGKINNETALADGDQIYIGQTDLLFTEKDFADRESALSHFKKVGERFRPTMIE